MSCSGCWIPCHKWTYISLFWHGHLDWLVFNSHLVWLSRLVLSFKLDYTVGRASFVLEVFVYTLFL